ncbi:MAG: HTH domain-containing protein, partial [Acinetobacter sp.]|nr:HTH domain-containing protein [Acinetobacter sp.]
MTREATAHERLANILTKLNMGCQLSVKELAEEFSVNPRTITRDFDRLSRFLNLIEDPQSRKFYL